MFKHVPKTRQDFQYNSTTTVMFKHIPETRQDFHYNSTTVCSSMYPKHDRTFTTTAQQYVQACTQNTTGPSLQQHNSMFKHVPQTWQDFHYNSTMVCSNMYPKHDRTFTTTAQQYVQTGTPNMTGLSLQQHNSMFKHVPQTWQDFSLQQHNSMFKHVPQTWQDFHYNITTVCSNMYPKHDRLSLQQHNGMFKHVPQTWQDFHYNITTVCSNMYPKHDRTFTTTAQWYVQACTQNTTGPSLQQHNSMFKHVAQTWQDFHYNSTTVCSNMYPKHDRTFTTTAQQYVQTCTQNTTGLSLQQHNSMFKHVPQTQQGLHYNSTTVCSNMHPKHDRTFTTTAQWYVQTCTQNMTGPSLQQHNGMFKHVLQTWQDFHYNITTVCSNMYPKHDRTFTTTAQQYVQTCTPNMTGFSLQHHNGMFKHVPQTRQDFHHNRTMVCSNMYPKHVRTFIKTAQWYVQTCTPNMTGLSVQQHNSMFKHVPQTWQAFH